MLIFGCRTSTISDFMRDKAKVWFTSSWLMLARLSGPKRYTVQDLSVYLIVNGNKTKNNNKRRVLVKYVQFNIN